MFVLKLNADSYLDVDAEQSDEYPLRRAIRSRVEEFGSVACLTADPHWGRCRSSICVGREVAAGDTHIPPASRRDYGVSPGCQLSLGTAYYWKGCDGCGVRGLHKGRCRTVGTQPDEGKVPQEVEGSIEEWHQYPLFAGGIQVSCIFLLVSISLWCFILCTKLVRICSGKLPEDAVEETIDRWTRAYIMELFSCWLFPDSSGSTVPACMLQWLRDLADPPQMNWGAAVLACLYRSLCIACRV